MILSRISRKGGSKSGILDAEVKVYRYEYSSEFIYREREEDREIFTVRT